MSQWQDTMEALVRDRQRALVGYAYLVCADSTMAQDLVQEALVKTFSRSRGPMTVPAAEAYVRRAIATVYIDGYRREQRWRKVQHLFRPEAVEPDRIAAIDAGAGVQEAIAALPPRERTCIVLRYFDDLTVRQIAEHLGLATGTVKRYLSDALDRLELTLGPLDDERDPLDAPESEEVR